MEKFEEKEIETKRIFKGRLLGLRVDTVELPNGKRSTREIVEHPGAVAIVAVTDDKEMVLVRQYRKATGEVLIEIPAGVPLAGEKGEEAARRELEEETGYHARKISSLWDGYTSPGYSDEMIHYFLAQEMNMMKQHTDEDEFVEVVLVDIEAALDLAKTGRIKDNKTLIGIMLADKFLKGE